MASLDTVIKYFLAKKFGGFGVVAELLNCLSGIH